MVDEFQGATRQAGLGQALECERGKTRVQRRRKMALREDQGNQRVRLPRTWCRKRCQIISCGEGGGPWGEMDLGSIYIGEQLGWESALPVAQGGRCWHIAATNPT